MNAFPHYFKAMPPGCTHVDVYRVLQLFEVADPALQHAVKKLLCAGARGAKDQAQDVAEAIATLQRWQQMRLEELPWKRCECRDRLAESCPGTWEPGCDTGANEAQAVPAGEDAEAAMHQAINLDDFPNLAQFVENAPAVLKRYGAKDLNELIEKLKAERAARWANAPAEATHLTEDYDGECRWYSGEPRLLGSQVWDGGKGHVFWDAGYHKLGRVACEPRPGAER